MTLARYRRCSIMYATTGKPRTPRDDESDALRQSVNAQALRGAGSSFFLSSTRARREAATRAARQPKPAPLRLFASFFLSRRGPPAGAARGAGPAVREEEILD
jgi:hypothetical protein